MSSAAAALYAPQLVLLLNRPALTVQAKATDWQSRSHDKGNPGHSTTADVIRGTNKAETETLSGPTY